MSDDARHGKPDDETRPLDLAALRMPLVSDPEPSVAAALAVIQRSLHEMARHPTRPLLDPPQRPFRLRPLAATGLALFPVALDVSRLSAAPDRASAHRALDAYAAAGGNTLVVEDAPDGLAAQTAGTWLASRRRREATVLGARVGTAGALTAAGLPEAVERVLHRLGAARLDLLILTDDGRTPMEETLTAAAGLQDSDRVGHIVAGDHAPERLMRARVLAGQRGLPMFDAVAPVHSLLDREGWEVRLGPVARAQGLVCLPRSPLAGGFLAAAVPTRGALRRLRELDPERADRLQPVLNRRGMRIVEAVVRIAGEREVPPSAVALAWLLTRPFVVAPVVAASSVEHVLAVVQAAGVHLSRAEAATLDRASAG